MSSKQKKNTVLFLLSQAVSLFGSSLVQFAIVWFVTQKTSSGVWVSLLTAAAYVPQFFISFFAGVWADRHSKKKLIVFSDASIALTTLVLALLLPFIGEGTGVLTLLLVASCLRSVGTGIQTPAVGAMLPTLVPEEKLLRVNGINATIQSVVQFAAPAAAGAILTVATLRAALFVDIATAAAGISLLVCLRLPADENAVPTAADSVFSDLKNGVRYTFSDSFFSRLLPLFGAFIFLCVPAGFLATLFVTRTFGDSYLHMTAVELVGFAGMALGGLLLGAWGGFRNRMTTLLTGLAAFGALAVGMGLSTSFPLYLALMLVYGIALTLVQTAVTTLIQEKAAPAVQGRVFGLQNAMFSGFLPLGMAVFGPLSDAVDMRWIMAGSGVALLLIALAVLCSRSFCRAGLPAAEENTKPA